MGQALVQEGARSVFGGRRGPRFSALALVVAAVLAVTAGCSGDKPKAEPTHKPTPTGPTLLSFAVYGPPQVITAYAKIAASFTAEHPDTVVNVKPYDSAEAAHAAIAKQLADGDPPDVFLAPLTDLPDLVANHSVRRLDELLGERNVDFGDGYQRYSLEAFSAENALQCMPVDVSPMVVYYNTDLIHLPLLTTPGSKTITSETGWSLDQFAAAAHQVKKSGSRGVYIAPTLQQIAPFIWSGGGSLVDHLDEPTTLTLAGGSTEKALEKLLEIVRDPTITFSKKQLASRSALQRFKSGQLGMMLGYRSLTPVLRAQQGLNFDVMPMPKVGSKATAGESSGLCISAKSAHPNKTADFIAYAVSDDSSALLADTGYVVPVNLDVANSDAFLQPGDEPASAEIFNNTVRNIRRFSSADTWPSVEKSTATLLSDLFYDAVIDPLDGRLKAIDAASAPLFTPIPTPSGTTSPSATPTS
ncbi:ABC transporter substrate-binding protein [Nocardioides marmorisolisilvae]|uniref:ABC transporter substrate-binding protein n=1 Tax=Nocardioides marmorisolisilvae TaxID=1542737 RepID=UPI00160C3D6C|nr:extracellular solute-binding protein [Nocardioides marmorisolisilvae]